MNVAATEILKHVENAETVDRFTHINDDKYNEITLDIHTNVSKMKHMSNNKNVRDVGSN
jgi:hypothetical protein